MASALALGSLLTRFSCKPGYHSKNYCTTSQKIPISLIKDLRERTKAGIQDCRSALLKNDLNIEKSIQWLEAQAESVATKKASKTAAEGMLAIASNHLNTKMALVELLCETDFASRSSSFVQTLAHLTKQALNESHADRSSLHQAENVQNQLNQLIYTLKENINLRRVHLFEADVLGIYMHQRIDKDLDHLLDSEGGRLFVGPRAGIVSFRLQGDKIELAKTEVQPFADKLAIHVLSMNPQSVDKESAPLGTELDDVLMEQEFIFESGKTVRQALEEEQFKLQGKHQVTLSFNSFKNFTCGEGMQKNSKSFASEVADLLKT